MRPIQQKIYNGVLKSKHSSFLWKKKLLPLPYAHFENNRNISVELIDAWDTMTRKFFSAAALVHEVFDYDFIVKVNTTTYVNIMELEKSLSKFVGTTFWGGAVQKGKSFTGGWATVLSRDLVEKLFEFLNHSQRGHVVAKYEDEAIGNLLNLIGEEPMPMKFAGLKSELELESLVLENLPFIRIKSDHERLELEPKLFQFIHRKIKSA